MSGVLGALLASRPSAAVGSFDLLSTTILTSNTASVTFASLGTFAADYEHLQLRITSRTTAASNSQLSMRFNGDAGNNYSEHQLTGNGSNVSSYGIGSNNQAFLGTPFASGAAANAFGAYIVDLLDAFSTNKNTTVRSLTGGPAIGLFSAGWFNTASLTSVEIFMTLANHVTGSRFSLYGLRKV